MHVPAQHSAPLPMLLVFHGAGAAGRDMQSGAGFDEWADRLGFIAVYPDAVADARHTWALGCRQCTWADVAGIDDHQFIRDLVDSVAARYAVDRDRVYAAGFSLGGSFAFDVACHAPDLIAGTAVVASLPSLEEMPLCRSNARPTSVITVIGAVDPNVPWAGGFGGSGATYISASETAAHWARRDGCDAGEDVFRLPDVNADGMSATVLEHRGCTRPSFVRFFKVDGLGHGWPRLPEFDATLEIVQSFFGTGSRIASPF